MGPRQLSRGNVITRFVLLAILVGASVWMLWGRSRVQETSSSRWTGATMGTRWTVEVVGTSATTGDEQQEIQQILDEIEFAMSTWIRESELSRFNAAPANTPFEVSDATVEVLRIAQEVSSQSGGAFDATIEPLIEAWGFNTASVGTWTRPSPESVAEAKARVDYRGLQLDPRARTILKTVEGLELDLSAVAKGYAVDRVAESLEARGVERYMVEVGGEVRLRGRGEHDGPWRIGLERPDPEETAPHAVLSLMEGAVATSGTYRNFYASAGERLSHLLDPREGAPVRHATVSVTVLHGSCAYADAWATALLVLGSTEGHALAEKLGIRALFVDHEGDGWARRATSTFGPFEVVDSP